MSPLISKNSKLLVNDNKLATSLDCCCPEFRWLRPATRIGGISDTFEQFFLVASNQPPGAPYPGQRIPGTESNAEWMPNNPGPGGAPIVYPLTDSTQTFYVTYDKIARNVKYRLQNGEKESVAIVPVNKLTSETVSYPIGIYVEARGRIDSNTIITLNAKIKFFNCTLSVVGEAPVQLPDTEVAWNRGNWVPGQPNPPAQTFERTLNPGYKLGKGFTINGSITMSWEGIRPTGNQIQGWIVLYDFTRDYII